MKFSEPRGMDKIYPFHSTINIIWLAWCEILNIIFWNPLNFQVEEAFTKFDTSGDQR